MVEMPACAETIRVHVGIIDGLYQYRVISPYNKIYHKDIMIVEGAFQITIADFPDGFFNPWMGVYYLQIFGDDENCNLQPFNICGDDYTTIGITVLEMVDAAEPYELICQCPEP